MSGGGGFEEPPGFRKTQNRIDTIAAVVFGVIGLFFLLTIIGICVCCLVPACWLSQQSRDRRRQLQGGQLPPPAYQGQPGGYGQFGGQPMYGTAPPSQQQFNQQSPPNNMYNPSVAASNPSTPAGTGVPPPYPTQQ